MSLNRPMVGGGDEEASQATRLVGLAEQGDLFHDALGDGYAAIEQNGHRETWSLRSSSFKTWLAHQFFLQYGRAPSSGALTDALTIIAGKAQFEGDERPIFTRIAAGGDGCLYLDLGTPAWDAVRIGPDGWEMVPRPPVHFWRGQATGTLPHPVRDGSFDGLHLLLERLSESEFRKVVGWLVGAFSAAGP
jgi:hypothetical protein